MVSVSKLCSDLSEVGVCWGNVCGRCLSGVGVVVVERLFVVILVFKINIDLLKF